MRRHAQALRRDVHATPTAARPAWSSAATTAPAPGRRATPMTHAGSAWTVTVSVPVEPAGPVQVLRQRHDVGDRPEQPATPTTPSDDGTASTQPITCPASYTCATPPVPPPGRLRLARRGHLLRLRRPLLRRRPVEQLQRVGRAADATSSTNYLGRRLGGRHAEDHAAATSPTSASTPLAHRAPQERRRRGRPGRHLQRRQLLDRRAHVLRLPRLLAHRSDADRELLRHAPRDLTALVPAAHAKNLKVLFDYAMVHVHTESAVYQQHKNDSPSWFTPSCICGDRTAAAATTTTTRCWFTQLPGALGLHELRRPRAPTRSTPRSQLVQTSATTPSASTPSSRSTRAGSPRSGRQIASQILATETPPAALLHGRRDLRLPEPRPHREPRSTPRRSSTGSSTSRCASGSSRRCSCAARRTCSRRTTSNWSRNAPPGMTGLSQFMDSNDTFYPSDAVMSTFIGNHDLPRSIHYAEQTLPGWLGSLGHRRQEQLVVEPAGARDGSERVRAPGQRVRRLLTNKGAPLIYYGDEIGLPGAGDPDNRRMMQWTGLRRRAAGPARPHQGAHGDPRRAPGDAPRHAHHARRDEDLWVYKLTTPPGDPAGHGLRRHQPQRRRPARPARCRRASPSSSRTRPRARHR